MTSSARSRIATAAVALLVAAYATLLFANIVFAVFGSDTAGYYNTARMYVQGNTRWYPPALRELGLGNEYLLPFTPLGFVPVDGGTQLAPFYPPGFPLHIAFAGVVGGFRVAPFFISPLAALVAVALTYVLARELNGTRGTAVLSATTMAFCPVLIFEGVQLMSDVTATAWSIAAIVFALKSRRKTSLAAVAGLCFAVAVLVRPANVILIVPLLVALRARLRTLSLFAAAGAPFAVALALYNWRVYGHPLTSGYSIVGDASNFALANIPPRFAHYGEWTIRQFGPLLPVAAIAGVFLARREDRRPFLVMASWLAVFFITYSLYGYYREWWSTRFLLPAYAAVAVTGFVIADQKTRGSPTAARRWVMTILAISGIGAGVLTARDNHVQRADRWHSIFPRSAAWANANLPPGSLIVSRDMSAALLVYSRFQPVRWDLTTRDQMTAIHRKAGEKGRRLFALLIDHEIGEFEQQFSGWFVPVGRYGKATIWMPSSDVIP